MSSHFLLAYFLPERDADGEQVRFAVSDGPEPTDWTPLNGGHPVLRSTVGEHGTRDPFLVRNSATGRFHVIATDLRVYPDQNWERATRNGSRSIVEWSSNDLVQWSDPALRELSPPAAGNTWAPKAFWSEREQAWLVFWASALFDEGQDRSVGSYQRILVAATRDFATFSKPRVHLDLGHDVIDVTFLEHAGNWYRFSANALTARLDPNRGHHIFQEFGATLEDPVFEPLREDVGRETLAHAEGPAVAKSPTANRWYLLADEHGLRGYQVFVTSDLGSGQWEHLTDAHLPENARHGSLLAITDSERERLLAADWKHA